MKIVINTEWGGITTESASKRYNAQFIEDVESGRFVGEVVDKWGYAENLKVVQIPDNATDHKILNYDGIELVVYVVDGKIYYVGGENDESQKAYSSITSLEEE